MSFGIAEARPPYVTFEQRAVEDRAASIEQGKIVYKDQFFAVITMAGGRDTCEKLADEWIKDITTKAMNGNYDQRWADHFRSAYNNFKEGLDTPVFGTPITHCLMFTPSEQKQIIAANVKTLEDLAVAGEDVLARIGMGSRQYKERAISALKTVEGGKIAMQFEAVQVENDDLKRRLEEMERRFNELASEKPRRRQTAEAE